MTDVFEKRWIGAKITPAIKNLLKEIRESGEWHLRDGRRIPSTNILEAQGYIKKIRPGVYVAI